MTTASKALATVIPTYNPGRYLEETLRSLERQTLPPTEVIVVDDGSDVPVELPDVRLAIRLIRTTHAGTSAARNAGVRASSSPLIHILDHDDVIDPEFYEVVARVVAEHDDVDVVHTLTGFIDADGHRIEGQFPMSLPDYEEGDAPAQLLEQNVIGSVAAIFRRGLYDTIGGFQPYRFVQDWDFWIRAAVADCRFHVVPEILAWHRDHPDKQVRPANLEGIHRESMQMRRALPLPPRLRWRRARLTAEDRLRSAQIRMRRDGRVVPAILDIVSAAVLRPVGSARMLVWVLGDPTRHRNLQEVTTLDRGETRS